MVNAVSQQPQQAGQKIILVLLLGAFVAMFAGSFAYRMQGAGLVVEVRQKNEGQGGMGGMNAVMGMDMGAMRAIMDKLRANPDDPKVMVEVGNAFMMMQAWDKALEMFVMAEKMLPKDTSVQRGLGMVRFERKEFDLAKKAFDKVLAAEPKDALSHFNMGILLKHYMNKAAEGDAHFRKVLELAPEDQELVKGAQEELVSQKRQ